MSVFKTKLSKFVAVVSLAIGLGLSQQAMAYEYFSATNGCKIRTYDGEKLSKIDYKGSCKDGYANGEGSYIKFGTDGKQKLIYSGNLLNGMPHGKGTVKWADGSEYVGEWKEGRKQGQGTYTWADGSKYVGGWWSDQFQGLGKLTIPKSNTKAIESWENLENASYTADWRSYGRGKWVGDIYVAEGSFSNNKLEFACDSKSRKSCDDAFKKMMLESDQANIRTCQRRYVGEVIRTTRGTGWFARMENWQVVGVGKRKMTIRSAEQSDMMQEVDCNFNGSWN